MIAITHNLILLDENRLEKDHGVINTAEDERRQKRVAVMARVAAADGPTVSALLMIVRRATQRSVKFVRGCAMRFETILRRPSSSPPGRPLCNFITMKPGHQWIPTSM